MRYVLGLVILSGWAAVMVATGWLHLWLLLRSAGSVTAIGWLAGSAGLALLVGASPARMARMTLGLAFVVLGLALMAIPSDGQGIVTALRVGYGGAVLAILPRLWRRVPVRQAKAVTGKRGYLS